MVLGLKWDWHQRIVALIGNLLRHKFIVNGEEYSRFDAKNENAIVRRFLIMAGAIEPIGRLDKNLPEGEFKRQLYRAVGGFYRGNRFIYRLNTKRLDDISKWIQGGDAPELVCFPDPLELKRKRVCIVLIPKKETERNPSDFPWYVGW